MKKIQTVHHSTLLTNFYFEPKENLMPKVNRQKVSKESLYSLTTYKILFALQERKKETIIIPEYEYLM